MTNHFFDSRAKKIIWGLFLVNLLIIGFFWWQNASILFRGSGHSFILAIADLAGLLGAYLIFWQFILMGRARWIEQSFGLDKLAKLHRLNGDTAMLVIITHVLLVTMAAGGSFFSSLWRIINTREDVWMAALAFYLLGGVVLMSIAIVRRHYKFETWYYVHLLVYLVILLAFTHQLNVGSSFIRQPVFVWYWWTLYILVALNHLFWRFGLPLWNYHDFRFRVDQVIPETNDVASIYIRGRNLERFRVKAGQFALWRFFTKGRWWQAHPFSFSQPMNGNSLRISVKALGDFTNELASLPVGTPVFVEGPYGTFTLPANHDEKLLLIAGGIGITPIRSMAEQANQEKRDTILIYSVKQASEFCFQDELRHLTHVRKTYFSSNQANRLLTGQEVAKNVPDITERTIYICGPLSMMNALTEQFIALGIRPTRIYSERFALVP